ncbi:MAG: UDP-N-acetylglucosamine 2-epimerase (non-hydrolyzing) [Proteobacteria bacterium]|nr:UDP-N-acetylglucosamine 2-epimerase (non-hydrolyzing) [Pseudomonadota bacterium]MBU4013707.1 UDP-N-acetylglucosamine 2-epimerase (non-hydrolyzing) [Pseudomonadota bacterium]MBU4068264.1 UDP-N-acetylglucosamine 2-epimerase (non-hydrolyzing) [Pseudomonadota bacterium]MBU4127731.1 UDP-N-acetylglucosamine 2-epimerase (non-hydrolyzing) [Pseudomonadota bacterium]
MKVLLIAGARPNFMKIAPIYRESLKYDHVECRIVHTGQHYDYDMSQAFFEDLELPEPDFFLNTGSGTHGVQTAKIMVAFEELCQEERPDLVIVVGDVNSTLACSIVAKKALIEVAHVEAGLRSFDLTMPEEINRMVTDSISDYFFVTEESGEKNLLQEGRPKEKIHFVGNVMIDNLFYQAKKLEKDNVSGFPTFELKQQNRDYVFLTLHRPSNVDTKESFEEIAFALNQIAMERPIFFPVHPRTRKMMEQFDISFSENIHLLSPLGFKESLFLWKDAVLVMTDSGGLQEETTALGVPCITLRENTERPITIEMGTNVLGGTGKDSILKSYRDSMKKKKKFSMPPKWDGKAAERIWKVLCG